MKNDRDIYLLGGPKDGQILHGITGETIVYTGIFGGGDDFVEFYYDINRIKINSEDVWVGIPRDGDLKEIIEKVFERYGDYKDFFQRNNENKI